MKNNAMSKLKFDEQAFSASAKYQSANKDFYGVFTGQYGRLYIVSRGIGTEGAEIISDLVVIAIKTFFEKLPSQYDSSLAIIQAIQVATKEVLSYISSHKWLSNCGAAIAILLSNTTGTCLATAGDCRILLLRRNKITCLCPKIKENWAIDTDSLVNTIGLTQVDPEIVENVKLYRDDCVLLTTKGVYQRVTRQEIAKALNKKILSEGIKTLWDFAKNKKSNEDFTLIALKILKAQPLPANDLTTEKDIVKFILLCILLALSLLVMYFTFYPYLNEIKAILNI